VTKWNVDMLAVANVFVAIGTLILAFGIPWTIVYALREKRDAFYGTLDNTYFEIQKTIIQYPHLCRPDPAGKTPDQLCQYDAFAFMVWNFLESIYDYAEDDQVLRETWDCILHPSNRPKFKPSFLEFIAREKCILEALPSDAPGPLQVAASESARKD
jgi:hypothetical protein